MSAQSQPLSKQQKKALQLAARVSLYAKKFFMVDGDVKSEVIGICNPIPEQWVMAEEVLRLLHSRRKEWDGGTFRVVLHRVKPEVRDPVNGIWNRYVPTLMEVQFLDRDGDIQFLIEYPDDPVTIMDNIGCSRIGDEAEEAYNHWKKFHGTVDIKPEQTYKAAQGEKPITGIDAPSSMVSGA
jgi:hypothetical protein